MAAHYPQSINLGDVNADDFCERAAAAGRPNILIFGSPCQSYSIAGKRLGMDDPRGNLALTALGIVARLKPDWFVFENVPGLFSSYSGSEYAEGQVREGPIGGRGDGEENRDFATFLARVQDIGYFGAWTVLDAQYRGVAQRRDRVFFVGHFRDWRAPAAVLLEPESLRGNHPPRREAGQNVTGTLSARTEGGGGLGTDFDLGGGVVEVAMCLNAGGMGRLDSESETLIPIQHGGSFNDRISHALRAEGFDASEDGTGRGTPLVAMAVALRGREGGATAELGDDKAFTLRSSGGGGDKPHVLAFSSKDYGADASPDLAPTLRAMNHTESHANAGGQLAVAFNWQGGWRANDARLRPVKRDNLGSSSRSDSSSSYRCGPTPYPQRMRKTAGIPG